MRAEIDESAGGDTIVSTVARWDTPPPPDVVAALNNLVQAYAFFTDEGRADELAGLFTADATWDGTSLGYAAARGPEAIAATVLAHFDAARPMIHLPGPPLLVQLSAAEVQGVGWCMATRSGGGPLIFFYYQDRFRRDEAGSWRFSSRLLHLRFRSASG